MKAVLISIHPHWCELIASGEKTLEVRKTRPKMETPFKCYIYCTNKRPFLVWGDIFRGDWETEFTSLYGYSRKEAERIWDVFNGRVMGEFICYKILSIGRRGVNNNFDYCYESLNTFGNDDIEPYIKAIRESCVGKNELHEYAKDNPYLYGWHISDLVIYDKPKKLSEFYKFGALSIEDMDEDLCSHCSATGYGDKKECYTPNGVDMCEGRWCADAYQAYLDDEFALTSPPQSWCYVEEV